MFINFGVHWGINANTSFTFLKAYIGGIYKDHGSVKQ